MQFHFLTICVGRSQLFARAQEPEMLKALAKTKLQERTAVVREEAASEPDASPERA